MHGSVIELSIIAEPSICTKISSACFHRLQICSAQDKANNVAPTSSTSSVDGVLFIHESLIYIPMQS